MSNRPNSRTLPTQPIVSRPIKAKHALKSKLSDFSSNKAPVSIPKYVNSILATPPYNEIKYGIKTKKAMVNAIERYLNTPDIHTGNLPEMPSPTQCKILFEGLM